MQDAKTNCALDLLSNPHCTIDISLRQKLGKEVDLTRDVRVRRDGGQGGGATAKAVAAVWGPGEENRAAVVLIAQARLFNKNYLSDLLAHPQEHFPYVHSMEFSRSELPHVHNRVLRDMPVT